MSEATTVVLGWVLTLGHSPDSDDAFMFYALAEGKIDSEGLEFEHVLRDIQTLNEWARDGKLDTTAISVHAYAYVQDKYALLAHGASMGDGYGPMIVTKEPTTIDALVGKRFVFLGLLSLVFFVFLFFLV